MDFQRNKTKWKERMKDRETAPSRRWAQRIFWYTEGKTGEPMVPLGLQNNTIKRGEGWRRKGGIFRERRITKKILWRIENLEKISEITSQYPREKPL